MQKQKDSAESASVLASYRKAIAVAKRADDAKLRRAIDQVSNFVLGGVPTDDSADFVYVIVTCRKIDRSLPTNVGVVPILTTTTSG